MARVNPARSTRGRRVADFTADEMEKDAAFWGADIWGENEDDSYSSEAEKPDVFDSDFNDSTSDESEGEAEEDERPRKKRKQPAAAYREPAARRRRRPEPGSAEAEAAKERRRQLAEARREAAAQMGPRTLRRSTHSKSETAAAVRAAQEAVEKRKPPPKKREVPRQLSQQAMLEEAAQTEIANQISLAQMQRVFDKQRAQALPRQPFRGSYTRVRSRVDKHTRCVESVITFTGVEVPALFASGAPRKRSRVCAVTGKPARYVDPVTGQPYHDLAAFKKLRG